MGFVAGFEKLAGSEKKDRDPHTVRRVLLGNPLSAAISAKKGKKWEAFTDAYGHVMKEDMKHSVPAAGIGLAGGTVAGAGVGAYKAMKGAKKAKLTKVLKSNKLKEGALLGALIGTAGGGLLGSAYGNLHGHLGAEGTKIHQKYSE